MLCLGWFSSLLVATLLREAVLLAGWLAAQAGFAWPGLPHASALAVVALALLEV